MDIRLLEVQTLFIIACTCLVAHAAPGATPHAIKDHTDHGSNTHTTHASHGVCDLPDNKLVLLNGGCDFNNEKCGYTFPDVLWSIHTESFGGYIYGKVTGDDQGSTQTFALFQSSDSKGNESLNMMSEIDSPTIYTTGSICLKFWYLMPNQNSKLEIYLTPQGDVTGGTLVFAYKYQPTSQWTEIKVLLDVTTPSTIRFVSEKENNYGYVGIDHVQLYRAKIVTTTTTTTTSASTTTTPTTTRTTTTPTTTSTTTNTPTTTTTPYITRVLTGTTMITPTNFTSATHPTDTATLSTTAASGPFTAATVSALPITNKTDITLASFTLPVALSTPTIHSTTTYKTTRAFTPPTPGTTPTSAASTTTTSEPPTSTTEPTTTVCTCSCPSVPTACAASLTTATPKPAPTICDLPGNQLSVLSQYSCSFDHGYCDYNLPSYPHLWEVTSFRYGDASIGLILGDQSKDHTGGYMVFNTYNNHVQNNTQHVLATPTMLAFTDYCLSFWYLMPNNQSNMKVYIRDTSRNNRTLIWNVAHAQTRDWMNVKLAITEQTSFVIEFVGTKESELSYFALDTVHVSIGNVWYMGAGPFKWPAIQFTELYMTLFRGSIYESTWIVPVRPVIPIKGSLSDQPLKHTLDNPDDSVCPCTCPSVKVIDCNTPIDQPDMLFLYTYFYETFAKARLEHLSLAHRINFLILGTDHVFSVPLIDILMSSFTD